MVLFLFKWTIFREWMPVQSHRSMFMRFRLPPVRFWIRPKPLSTIKKNRPQDDAVHGPQAHGTPLCRLARQSCRERLHENHDARMMFQTGGIGRTRTWFRRKSREGGSYKVNNNLVTVRACSRPESLARRWLRDQGIVTFRIRSDNVQSFLEILLVKTRR
jgi:hypothetical protein